ncbi:DUF222 domain-containing protein [Actinomadura alba]|uniref:DUF222 domain-containing protein n=1 Tax=Actinomadura alba TaxID=406431 RepID=A0ABR7LXB9_9ACTN|nr:DUF222 domain-containing protein [Actinomadura alba]MBC6469419.1 DUF222 domain-containing protein [Actinomadura alba]
MGSIKAPSPEAPSPGGPSPGGPSPEAAPNTPPSVLAMRIGVVAAEAAFASFARNIDFDEVAEGGVDFEGSIDAADWPVFRLVLDTLAAAKGPGDTRTLDERWADALNDLARICLAAKRAGTAA